MGAVARPRRSGQVAADGRGLAGMSKDTLNRIERGERSPTLNEVLALADALQISVSDLTRLPVPAPANGHTDSTTEAVGLVLDGIEADQRAESHLLLGGVRGRAGAAAGTPRRRGTGAAPRGDALSPSSAARPVRPRHPRRAAQALAAGCGRPGVTGHGPPGRSAWVAHRGCLPGETPDVITDPADATTKLRSVTTDTVREGMHSDQAELPRQCRCSSPVPSPGTGTLLTAAKRHVRVIVRTLSAGE